MDLTVIYWTMAVTSLSKAVAIKHPDQTILLEDVFSIFGCVFISPTLIV
jgi:hypothetical protein